MKKLIILTFLCVSVTVLIWNMGAADGVLQVLNGSTSSGGTTYLGELLGVTNASGATTGYYGEVLSGKIASGSAQALQTTVATNVTSLSLSAGDWDVSGNINFTGTASTITATSGGITTTSVTVPTDGTEVFSGVVTTLITETDSITIPRKQINVSSTTTVYLVGKCTFSAGSVSAFGSITARRMR